MMQRGSRTSISCDPWITIQIPAYSPSGRCSRQSVRVLIATYRLSHTAHLHVCAHVCLCACVCMRASDSAIVDQASKDEVSYISMEVRN